MRVIVLAAGQGYQLGGYNKLLLKHPVFGKRIIDQFIDMFSNDSLTFVVGYRAIEVIQEYPQMNFVYNPDWQITNNAYSLSLAIDDTPSVVISGDLFIDLSIKEYIYNSPDNCVFTQFKENRQLSALNCIVRDNMVKELYQGSIRSVDDPEAVGIYKIFDKSLLRQWKNNCVSFGNLFVGQNLQFDLIPIYSQEIENGLVAEINTVFDYLNLINQE